MTTELYCKFIDYCPDMQKLNQSIKKGQINEDLALQYDELCTRAPVTCRIKSILEQEMQKNESFI